MKMKTLLQVRAFQMKIFSLPVCVFTGLDLLPCFTGPFSFSLIQARTEIMGHLHQKIDELPVHDLITILELYFKKYFIQEYV